MRLKYEIFVIVWLDKNDFFKTKNSIYVKISSASDLHVLDLVDDKFPLLTVLE